jgi:chorismate mutase
VKRYLALFSAFASPWLWLIATGLCASDPQIKLEQVLQTMQSWDGTPYTSYPIARYAGVGSADRLEACRQQIDSLDQELVALIQRRAQVVQEVANIKREAHLGVKDSNREQQIIDKVQALAKGGPLPPEAVGRVYQKLIQEMRNWEEQMSRIEFRGFDKLEEAQAFC